MVLVRCGLAIPTVMVGCHLSLKVDKGSSRSMWAEAVVGRRRQT